MFSIRLDSNFSQYSTDLIYEFDNEQRFEDGRTRSFTTIANQDPEAARHFGFQPGQTNPTLEWVLYDDGTDKSGGSYADSNISDGRISGDTIETVEEQIIWLVEYIQDNTTDPRWELSGGRFSFTNVVVENVNTTLNAGETSASARIDLKLGVTV